MCGDSQSTRGHRHQLTPLATVERESGGAGKESTEVRELSKKDKLRMKKGVSSSVVASIR